MLKVLCENKNVESLVKSSRAGKKADILSIYSSQLYIEEKKDSGDAREREPNAINVNF